LDQVVNVFILKRGKDSKKQNILNMRGRKGEGENGRLGEKG
jgi:hypothetical protein